jgi:hypothetical protein
VEGYVSLNTNRYSVPVTWIGRRVEIRETQDNIEIQLDCRNLVTHERIPDEQHQRVTLSAHRPPRGQGIKRAEIHPEEQAILILAPEITDYLASLKKNSHKLIVLALRQLLRFVRDYPRQPLLEAIEEASHYGLYDLDRLERMILRRVHSNFFLLNPNPDKDPHDE